jgi:hypothetical protein
MRKNSNRDIYRRLTVIWNRESNGSQPMQGTYHKLMIALSEQSERKHCMGALMMQAQTVDVLRD